MGLGDVTSSTYPKMCLVAPPRAGGSISTRTFIPHTVHDAIGVLQAVTVGTAAVLEGSVAHDVAVPASGLVRRTSVEHPSGGFGVELELDPADPQRVVRAALLRTARLIMRGEVLIPASVWKGNPR
jgi:4-oxalomesaconate tautomerase